MIVILNILEPSQMWIQVSLIYTPSSSLFIYLFKINFFLIINFFFLKALISFIFYFEQAMEDANIENELNCKDTR